MRNPGLLCLILESTQSFTHFRHRHFGSLSNCQKPARSLEVKSVRALLLPMTILPFQQSPLVVSVRFSRVVRHSGLSARVTYLD